MAKGKINNDLYREFGQWWKDHSIESTDWNRYQVGEAAYLEGKQSAQEIIDMLCWRLDTASSCVHDSETCRRDQQIIDEYESIEHRMKRGK